MTQRNESASWKTEYWKSLKQNRKKNEKRGQFKRPLRQHQKYQHYIIGVSKEEREKGADNIQIVKDQGCESKSPESTVNYLL